MNIHFIIVYDEVYIHYNHLDPKHANDETMDLLKLLHLDQVVEMYYDYLDRMLVHLVK
jgi:hypothetical protein